MLSRRSVEIVKEKFTLFFSYTFVKCLGSSLVFMCIKQFLVIQRYVSVLKEQFDLDLHVYSSIFVSIPRILVVFYFFEIYMIISNKLQI